jgi:hypothetical protein
MTDAMGMFNAMRHAPPGTADGIQAAPASNRARELHDLAMVPGSPGYNARIPRPACTLCGDDHFPNREYDHAWTAEPVAVHDEPVSASSIVRRPTVVDVEPAAPTVRVAVYVGRGDDMYVVAAEGGADWDTVASFKVHAEHVLPMIELVQALGIKVSDKTGGDLVMLREEHVREYAQDHERGAARPGGGGPRRQGPAAPGAQEDRPA